MSGIKYNDKFHPIQEFASFPWHRIDADWLRLSSVGIDGQGRYVITFNEKDGSMDTWQVPIQLKQMHDQRKHCHRVGGIR